MEINKILILMGAIFILSACTDSRPESVKTAPPRQPDSISKPAPRTKPTSFNTIKKIERDSIAPKRFTEHELIEKKKQVLSSIDEGLQMIDSELNSNSPYN